MMAGRKPQPFDPATMDIRTYIRGFELYKRAANLSDEESIYAFMTYLDIDCQGRLERRYESDTETWAQFKEAAMEILDGPYTQSPLDARLALKGAKQRAGESVQDFGERIRRLGEIGFSAEIEAREANMRDALVSGVLLDQIGVHLIQVMTRMTYDELLQEAKRLERSYKSRQVLNGGTSNIEVTAMPARVLAATSSMPPNQISDFGDAPGLSPTTHRADNMNQTSQNQGGSSRPGCWYCGITGHIRRECRKRQNDMRNGYHVEQNLTRPRGTINAPRNGQRGGQRNGNQFNRTAEMQNHLPWVENYFNQQSGSNRFQNYNPNQFPRNNSNIPQGSSFNNNRTIPQGLGFNGYSNNPRDTQGNSQPQMTNVARLQEPTNSSSTSFDQKN
eukprot:sb/3465553/